MKQIFMQLHIGLVASILTALISSPAAAGTAVCNGTVQTIAYHQPGNLMIKLSNMNVPVFICNTDSDWTQQGSLGGATSPAACKALYAAFLAAKTSGAWISDLYLDGDDVTGSCDSFPNWGRVNVRYFNF